MPANGQPASEKVPALTKALAVIRHINAAPPSGASLHETATALGMTKSHCHNILKTLMHEGWLSYDAMRRSYSLAPRLLADVSRLLSRGTPTAVAHDELAKLSKALDTPCVLTRVEKDGSFVAIDSVEENSELLVSVPIGHRFPPDAPAQMRVRLAWMPDDQRKIELARWQPRAYTKTTIVRKKQVLAEIEATRRRGYSISWAEFTPGVMTLAVPIFDAFGRVQMVLQCPGLIDKVSRNEAKMAAAIVRAGERLNVIIGGSSDATSDIRIALS
jgi:DNA-binding IclR family transcriptional regulator